MNDETKRVREALEQLEEMQAHESSYAQINKLQGLLNTFAKLERAGELMADDLAARDGRSREQVLADFYRQAGM